jgi:hypothetical protein
VTSAAIPIERSHEELEAARVLLTSDLPSQALSRAYFAAFHAAEAALMATDAMPATAAGVMPAFARFATADPDLSDDFGRTLRKLFEDRNDVDFAMADAPAGEARNAIAEAERLVEATSRWIERRPRS